MKKLILIPFIATLMLSLPIGAMAADTTHHSTAHKAKVVKKKHSAKKKATKKPGVGKVCFSCTG